LGGEVKRQLGSALRPMRPESDRAAAARLGQVRAPKRDLGTAERKPGFGMLGSNMEEFSKTAVCLRRSALGN
jgi:hypothetical protein